MTPDQALDVVRHAFRGMPGDLSWHVSAWRDECEIQFSSHVFDCFGAVRVTPREMREEDWPRKKLLEVEGLADSLREAMLAGRYALRRGYPKQEATE